MGNSAVVPGGTALGNSVLLGVMSTPPPAEDGRVKDGTSWLGTPAIFSAQAAIERSRFPKESPIGRRENCILLRACIEYFRVTLPPTFMILLGAIWFFALTQIEKHTPRPRCCFWRRCCIYRAALLPRRSSSPRNGS